MTRDAPVVVVRGDEDDAVAEAVAAAGGVVRAPDERGRRGTDPDAVVAVGEDALFELAGRDASAPILPVACNVGRASVSRSTVGDAVRALRTGGTRVVSHPVLAVAVDGDVAGSALADVTLMTDEPARISEYAVSTPHERVGSFRADGVVVATPLGSAGYARAAGGPILAPGTGVVAVPIAPYTTLSESWVFGLPVRLSVERDEASVSLVLDGEERRSVPPHAPVELTVDRRLPFLRLRDDGRES